ncbi:MAG: branched-chain amino acid ABC transporter permease [Deltaproteobacteria bacterium]|nr:branched-chain amino acid ABC transporter permease [Deltaproteobacteria bacterium]MBW2016762.1 branched-chain amino acid ABC transporter permease [Deltaproteobacteria bacterium]MBW2129306.1 branched-chain amino acid ABC transporter permease [Deltaproteobacteria bacterium]MBW2304211.1 branched-chain amino acid ABC transporter permease [Deltaproteobacteria bacterium]
MLAKKSLKLVMFLVWAFILLFPMLAVKDGQFVWERLLKVMAVLTASGLLVLAYTSIPKRTLKPGFTGKGLPFRIPPKGIIAAGIVFALVFPWLTSNYARDVAINVLIYISLGLGLNIVVGLAGLLDLGYIAFYAVGAYTYALLNTHFGVPFWIALPIGCIISALAGTIIGYPTLKMRGDYLAIVTLGFGEIIRIVLNNWDKVTRGPNGILGIKAPGVFYPTIGEGGIHFAHFYMKNLFWLYYLILVIAVIVMVSVYRLNTSRIGRAWMAVREDETAAELTGIHTTRMKLWAYILGSIFAGFAGAFFAAKVRYVNPSSFVFLESALVLCIVVLGGMGSIPGILLGAAAIIVLPEVFRDLELYRMAAFGGAMTLMMVFRPEGLIPAKPRKPDDEGEGKVSLSEEGARAHG